MPTWKVLLIGASACACLALAAAAFAAPFTLDGGGRWGWMGGLLAATLGAGALFGLFLRHAGAAMDARPRRPVWPRAR
jgi:hypothetical protein